MNILLLFFAIPIAVIIFSIALQKILKCPFLVAAVIFAILLIFTFAFFDCIFLVAAILYTILSFLVATLFRFFCQLNESREGENNNNHGTNSCGCQQNSIQTAQAASRMNSCSCCRRRF